MISTSTISVGCSRLDDRTREQRTLYGTVRILPRFRLFPDLPRQRLTPIHSHSIDAFWPAALPLQLHIKGISENILDSLLERSDPQTASNCSFAFSPFGNSLDALHMPFLSSRIFSARFLAKQTILFFPDKKFPPHSENNPLAMFVPPFSRVIRAFLTAHQ